MLQCKIYVIYKIHTYILKVAMAKLKFTSLISEVYVVATCFIVLSIIIIVYFRFVYKIACFSHQHFLYSCIGKWHVPEPCGYILLELGSLGNMKRTIKYMSAADNGSV